MGTFIISTSALHLFSPAYLSFIDGFGSGNHAVQTLGHDGNDSSLGLGEAPVRLPELHRPTLIHVLQILRHISEKKVSVKPGNLAGFCEQHGQRRLIYLFIFQYD